jgi:type IX secretion system PorP/SprF family membrane protein
MNLYIKLFKDRAMNAKRLILVTVIGLMISTGIKAQQLPICDHHYFDPMIYNPARIGMVYQGVSAFGLFRKQWVDMYGGPETKAFTIDGSLKKNKIGLGAIILSDKTDVLEKLTFSLGYSYKIPFNAYQGITLGIMAGFSDNTINYDKINAHDPGDIALFNQSKSDMGFEASAGVNYYWKKLNIGIAVPQLISKSFVYVDNNNKASMSEIQHYIFTANYVFTLKKDVLFLDPTLMLTYVQNAPFRYDFGLMFNWKEKAWLGGVFRSDNAISFIGGIRINQSIMFGYAYDMTNNDMQNYGGGSHEFILGYQFARKSVKDIEMHLLTQAQKVDSMTKKVEDLGKRVDTLEQHDTVFNQELQGIKDELKLLRVNAEKLKEEVKRDDKLPKFAGVVLFKTDSYKIDNQFQGDLMELVNVIQNFPDLRVDLRGHTDNVGSDYYNNKLSDNRVKAVRDFLISKGVSPDRISLNGLGERFPKVPNINEANKSLNRRVEMAVIKSIPQK